MGFRSGDCAGHNRVLMWWSFIHTFTDLAVWHGALAGQNTPHSWGTLSEQKEDFVYNNNYECFVLRITDTTKMYHSQKSARQSMWCLQVVHFCSVGDAENKALTIICT